jgi:hypothetical protein
MTHHSSQPLNFPGKLLSRRRQWLFIASALLGLVGMAPRAHADSEYFTATTTTPATAVNWSSSQALGFPQFNPSLGTLNSAEIALVITSNQGTITVSIPSIYVGDLGDYAEYIGTNVEYDPNAPEYMGYSSLEATSDTDNPVTTTIPSAQSTPTFDVPIQDLASFTGDGTKYLSASTVNGVSWSDDIYSFVAASGTMDISESLGGAIEYDYTPASVPEPTTAGLISMGLFGLLARRRRNNSPIAATKI